MKELSQERVRVSEDENRSDRRDGETRKRGPPERVIETAPVLA